MKNPMTAKEAREMAENNQNQFMHSWAMKEMLRFIKKRASQGYFSGVKEVSKDEVELIRANLEKFGYKAEIEKNLFEGRYHIRVAW